MTKEMTQEQHSFTLLFEPAEEGGYVVTCPALPGLVTEGDSLEEARSMAKEAVETHIEGLQKAGEPIPEDKKIPLEPRKEEIRVALRPA